MILDALKFNSTIQRNQFGAPKVAFTGSYNTGYENYGTGKGVNAENSTGVIGEVTGTGKNGKHLLNTYY